MQKKHEPDNFMTRLDLIRDEEASELDAWIARERFEFAALVAQFGFDPAECGARLTEIDFALFAS